MDQAARFLAPRGKALVERAGWVLAVSLGYYALDYVGTVLSVPPYGFAIVWPCSAFLAGALLLTPTRHWWTYLLGLIPVHLLLTSQVYDLQRVLVVAATQILGSAGLAAAIALAARRLSRGPVRFDSFRRALLFVAVAAIGVTGVFDAVQIGVLISLGWAHDFWLSWRQWMLASSFSTVTLTPLMVLTGRGVPLARGRNLRQVEVLIASGALFAITYLAFGLSGGEMGPALRLAPLPILMWAAVRWGVWGVCLSLLVVAAAVILRALGGAGPFATSASTIAVISLQEYLIAISIPLVLLAALMEERERTEAQLRGSEERTRIAAALTDTGLWQWDSASRELWMTAHCRTMFGLRPDLVYAPSAFLEAVHPEDRPGLRSALDEALGGQDVQTHGEFRAPSDGQDRWYVLRTRASRDSHGRTVRVTGIFRDISEWVIAHRQSEQLGARLLSLQEDERRNIAQALHDSTIQHLVAAGLITGMVERRLTGTDETRQLFDDLRGSLHKAVKELRTFSYLLRPPELEQHGLCEVLRKYVSGFGLRTGVKARARLSPEGDRLPIEQQQALMRITQESLANVHRHAGATQVSVDLRLYGDEIHLVIRDDGCGLPPSRGQSVNFGVGIPGMAARIRQLGGKIDVRSGASGAVVHASLPMARGIGPSPPPRQARDVVVAEAG